MTVVLLIAATAALLAWRFAAEAHAAALVAPRRHAIVTSAVATGAVLVAMTELLSLVRLVTWGGIAAGWTCALLASAFAAWRAPAHVATPVRVDPLVAAGVAAMALLAAATALVAWLAPPNNWDSMTYHMSRVVQWQAQASLAHYPTHITRQILYTPGAEMALLHLQIARGGDRLANLLQWAAFPGVMAGASLLAARLGAGMRAQAVAALFCATAPMAILESSSTQNDLIGAFWLIALAYFVALWRDRPSSWITLAVGASLGLAVVTKITLYVIALPWLAVLGVRALRAGRRGVRALLVVAAIAGALNAGHYARQARLWWSIEPAATATRVQPDAVPPRPEASGIARLVEAARAHAPAGGGTLRYVNAAMSPGLLASNVVRNVGLHVVLPSEAGRAVVNGAVRGVHELLGVSLIDARTTYPSGRAFRAPELSRHEDVAPNPLQLALALCAAAVLLLRRRWNETARAGALVACAFVLFAAVFKWQPWHARLHLPILVLAAPVVAAALLERASRGRALVLGATLVLASTPWVVANETRPLLGEASVLRVPRNDQYFAGRPNLREPYLGAVAWLRERGCGDVGIVIGGNEWEYPLWPLLGEADRRPVRIRHVNVANESRFAAAADPASLPCAVLAIGVPDAGDELTVEGRAYRQGFADGPVRGFVP